ncbi:bifunctional DNA-formamidopyrimidine glycosylase/DNA-(apurinic or apyrimidinic site) lyase [Anthocerotibacter panamensis]|uniref:bifunctional DNA-formamidopyrimidine glycosylase/DNA-(apurinic or apyrimidinic site) lyase n=1 Tax=Anthocerotibacter panamensis TaxID=2857077 RepID=UPI001C405953|nr:bifunctional DNA-formamidopyrimidine glycosylase/DNA-(apurinic or apyrimidinic site) lyase [Anthocerotibacter panamensis]
MPELPEVETVRRSLAPRLAGQEIQKVQVLRASAIAAPDVDVFTRLLPGQHFSATTARRGKYLLLGLESGGWLAVHLRMSGRLLLFEPPLPLDPSHLRVCFYLKEGSRLYFHDPRAFGRLWYIRPGTSLEEQIPALQRLGPEPEDLEVLHLEGALARRTIPIKVALLDQTLLAGLGNIYADEALFQAGIHPLTPANQLKRPNLERLIERIKWVLTSAVTAGGTTLRDYVDSQGSKGRYQEQLQVYGRFGQTCATCGTSIARLRLGGRSSHFCPSCQVFPRA